MRRAAGDDYPGDLFVLVGFGVCSARRPVVHPRQRSAHADSAGPVGAPETVVEAAGIEAAAQGLPDVGVGEGLVTQGAGPGNPDDHVPLTP